MRPSTLGTAIACRPIRPLSRSMVSMALLTLAVIPAGRERWASAWNVLADTDFGSFRFASAAFSFPNTR